jgi:hypothetical protein
MPKNRLTAREKWKGLRPAMSASAATSPTAETSHSFPFDPKSGSGADPRLAVKGVVLIATPHTGSLHATLLDRLRLIAWPSASTLDLVKNNAGLRDLNVW